MKAIKELEEKLNNEIEDRKDLETRFNTLLKNFNDLNVDIKKDFLRRKKSDETIEKKFDIKIERIENIKEQILNYTFQSATIIMGIFSIILAIIFLYLNVENLTKEYFGLFVSVIFFFAALFVLWFILWIKSN